jgi:hypothetical protein
MTDPDPQTFKLYGPTGEVIMTGSMSAIMERLPDTPARDAALDSMLKIACDAVEAEQRADEARESLLQTLTTGLTRLSARIDSFEKRLALSAKRAEAARIAEGQRRVQQYLDALPDPDKPDDGELTVKHAPDPVDTGLAPMPFGTEPDKPIPGPEPGSRLYEGPPQVPQPISISLNEADHVHR